MTTSIVTPTVDYHILSNDTNYTLAANGTGTTLDVKDFSTNMWTGQQWDGFSEYYAFEAFLKFDTSSISASADILTVNLSLWLNTQAGDDFTINAYAHTWSDPILTSNWLTPATMSGMSTIGTLNTASIPSGTDFYFNIPIDISAVNTSGDTDILLAGSTHVSATNPGTGSSVNEYIIFNPENYAPETPKLLVNINSPSMMGSDF